MKIVENEMIVAFDVDDTLVMWHSKVDPINKIQIINPYGGSETWLKPHKRHIELLKEYKGRGMTIIVWSAAGYKWAESVVNSLGIQDYVDLIMTKPGKLVDDLSVQEIFTTRIYLKDIE